MKLLIEFNNQKVLVNPTDSGALLAALGSAQLMNCEGYGNDKKYSPDMTGEITVLVFDETRLVAPTPIIVKLQEEKRLSDNRWIEYYNKCNAVEKCLKELKSDLDSRGITYKKDEVKP